ncbi:MAG: metal-dependent transcriptional regulator [Solirubrobacterales bacterium]|nr:metal-dependent transcriptional regulator [Solirubrobacterales bacterium]MCB8969660.1 metal-dependent transcriptional regulator [Thermoleophilales bacterium]MCO5327935.1 metal-dependent transcriptional regulator [Solirubrobacterales bacterium]
MGSRPTGAHGRIARDRASEAIEDYAKAIYALSRREEGPIGTSSLAERLGVSPGTVTSMLKRMDALGLLRYEPYRGVELTEAGTRMALEVIRHHRIIESYLAEALGMPWDRVHDEAEVLEHYISEELEERMAAALGDPSHDPHGDPIPSSELELAEEATRPLAGLEPGERGVFVRISDSDPEMLRYLGERGIAPGDRLELVGREPFDGPLSVRFDGGTFALGGGLARAMRVATAPKESS